MKDIFEHDVDGKHEETATQATSTLGGLLERYSIVRQLYKADIGNTTISTAHCKSPICSENNQLVILKEIDLSYLENPEYIQQSKDEFKIQSELNHEHIVRCFEYEINGRSIIAALELVNSPEYLSIELDDNMEPITNEFMLKTFMSELLEGLTYIHEHNIVHCDIKIENILGHKQPDESFPTLKICDFGLAKRVDPITKKVAIEKRMGTKEYIAPEVKDKAVISTKVDIWAMGLVFYKMCTTYLPTQLARDWVSKGLNVPFRDADWTDHSEKLKDLISKMLSINPEVRLSAEQALEHPFFNLEDC